MQKHKVLLTGSNAFAERFKNLAPDSIEIIQKNTDLTEDQLIEALFGIEAYILGGDEIVTRKIISAAKDLKAIAFIGAGYQSFIDVAAATEHNIIVTNTPGANAQTVAELTAGFILATAKHIVPLNESAKQGGWERQQVVNLHDKTLGIIGTGNIGSRVAHIMKNGFAMNILYYSRNEKPEFAKKCDAQRADLNTLLSKSDIVTIHIPLTPETEHLIAEKELALMKPSAILINTARAKIVDGHALYQALVTGKLASAAFDVYYEEPLPKPEADKYKLMTLPDEKFLLTPHNGANSQEAFDAMTQMTMESIAAVFSNQKPKYQVN